MAAKYLQKLWKDQGECVTFFIMQNYVNEFLNYEPSLKFVLSCGNLRSFLLIKKKKKLVKY